MMKSLWSRAGQAHRCGCGICGSAMSTLSRRTANAAGRRKPTFSEIFTACYSSMFATAAVVDAIRKEDRAQELDRQLEEARRDLAILKARGDSHDITKRSTANGELTVEQMDSLWQALRVIYHNRPFMKEIHRPATLSISELVTRVKSERYGCPNEATLAAMRQIDYDKLERAIALEELSSVNAARLPQTTRHLAKDASAVEQVVQHLMSRASILDQTSQPSPSFDEASRMIELKQFPSFGFYSAEPTKARENTRILNQRLRSLFSAPNLGLKERVGRVCFNLLVSAYPPDMHTYNTLIVAFNRSGEHALAEALVNSFFRSRLLKPTPSTFVAILNHYKATNNHGAFLRAIGSLTGSDGKIGAKYRRRHVDDVAESWVLRQWAADATRRTRTGDWIWEHVPVNRLLVDAAMKGFLHFKLFDQAASFLVSCMAANQLSMKMTVQVLTECLAALDWKAALRLIHGFSACHQALPSLLSAFDADAKALVAQRIYDLLDLCGVYANGQTLREAGLANLGLSGEELDGLLEALAATTGNDAVIGPMELHAGMKSTLSSDEASSRSGMLRVESLWKELRLSMSTVKSIESKLLYPHFSLEFRESMAEHIVKASLRASVQLGQDADQLCLTYNALPQITSDEVATLQHPKLLGEATAQERVETDNGMDSRVKSRTLEEEKSRLGMPPSASSRSRLPSAVTGAHLHRQGYRESLSGWTGSSQGHAAAFAHAS